MIAKLTGILDSVGDDWAILDVGGVGYLVFCSSRTLAQLPGTGEAVSFVIETHIREDHIHLYGFLDQSERDWFRLLTTVQGVGAKVGLAILGTLSVDELTTAIVAQDKAMLSRPDGVGPRLAARLMTELKDKILSLGGTFAPQPVAASASGSASAGTTTDDTGAAADAISALVNLGYGRAEAFGAVGRVIQAEGEDIGLNALIPAALKELGQ